MDKNGGIIDPDVDIELQSLAGGVPGGQEKSQRRGCCMDPFCGSLRYCFSPCNYLAFILGYFVIVAVVNFFCPASYFSPLPGGGADATALWLCLAAVTASVSAALHLRQARSRGEEGAARNLARRCTILLVVYFAFCLPSYFAANKSLYHDVESSDDGFGTNFIFTGANGVKLEG